MVWGLVQGVRVLGHHDAHQPDRHHSVQGDSSHRKSSGPVQRPGIHLHCLRPVVLRLHHPIKYGSFPLTVLFHCSMSGLEAVALYAVIFPMIRVRPLMVASMCVLSWIFVTSSHW